MGCWAPQTLTIRVYNKAVRVGAAGRGRYLDVANSAIVGRLELRSKIRLRDNKIKEAKSLMTAVIFRSLKKNRPYLI